MLDNLLYYYYGYYFYLHNIHAHHIQNILLLFIITIIAIFRYIKCARDVPQSEWTTGNGGRVGHYSVEEIINHQLKVELGNKTTECQFHACGREDVDVRMLG